MQAYFCRLAPPRPSFPSDITEAEAAAMQRHFAFWADRMKEGAAAVVGPVLDPAGTYGVAIVCAADLAQARSICGRDPVIAADLGFAYAVYEMPNALFASGVRQGD